MKRLTAIALAALWCAGGTASGQEINPPAPPPTTQPTPLAALKQEQQQIIERQHAGRPVIGPLNASQVVQLEIDNGRIIADTALPVGGGEQRVLVNDDPGMWWAVVHHRPDGRPMYMVVIRYDFSHPDNVFTHAMITASTSQLSLAGAVESADGITTTVELIDRSPVITPEEGVIDPGGMRLFVHAVDSQGNKNVNLRIEAADLTALRHTHPDVVNTYLRRVLSDLGQEQILAIDPKLAWQVLGGERPVDPEVLQRLHAILPRLDSDAFAEREAAADALNALGDAGAIAVAKLDRTSLSAEQNARIDEFLDKFKPATDREASKLADDPDFLLDVLLVDDIALRQRALNRLTETLGKPIDFDMTASESQRARQIAAIRQSLHRGVPTTRPTP